MTAEDRPVVEAPSRPAVGTGGRMTIRCHQACLSSPSGVCSCVIAEAAPKGVLVLRQEHSVAKAGRGSTNYNAQKHESCFTLFELMRLLLSAAEPSPLCCQVPGCDRDVARLIPGGILELRRTHYGEAHVRRFSLFEVLRLLQIADEKGGA